MDQTQPNILELAKQGNAKAIAILINRQLQPKGITAKAAFKDGCLQIMLESAQVPNQQALVAFIRKGITSLGTESIQKVKVYGRQKGEDFPAWSEEFELAVQPLPECQSQATQPADSIAPTQLSEQDLEDRAVKILIQGMAKSEDKEAIEDMTQAIRLNPNFADAYIERGSRYSRMLSYENAIEDYNRAIQLKPDHWLGYSLRGHLRSSLKDYQEALEDYSKAINLLPCALTYGNRGELYEQLELYQEAIEDFNQAISLEPTELKYQQRLQALNKKIGKPALSSSNKEPAKKQKFWNKNISLTSLIVFILLAMVWPVGLVYLLLKLTKWSNNVKRSIVGTLLCIYLLMIVLAANKTPEVTPVASVQSSVVDSKAENTQKSYTPTTPEEKFIADYQDSARKVDDSAIKIVLLLRADQEHQKIVTYAKGICEALAGGASWEQIVSAQISTMQSKQSSSIEQQAIVYDTKIINSLATVHFCPQFPRFR